MGSLSFDVDTCWRGGSLPGLRVASMNVQSLNNKVNDTLHLFDSRHLDLLLIQETCLDRESLDAIARMAKSEK